MRLRTQRKPLSAAFVRTITEPGRYGDGGRGNHGLALLVKAGASGRPTKSWVQRLRIAGRPTNLGLGAYPLVLLAKARSKALENHRAALEGHDPRITTSGAPTFKEAAEAVIALHEPSWRDPRSSEQWRSSLAQHVLPALGTKRIDIITKADLLEVLTPIWHTKAVTARRVHGRINAVLSWAVAKGYRDDHPGTAMASVLPKNTVPRMHHQAVPHAEVGAVLNQIREAGDWYLGTRLALEFLVLTACRSGEVRGARWEEIDMEKATWAIPGSRMKVGRPHEVPLSARAMEVLREAAELGGDSALVFPSQYGRLMESKRMSDLLRSLDIPGTVHGFRSSFKSWCGDSGQSRELAEAALAHTMGNRVEQAYHRTTLFDRRCELMAAWAEYCDRGVYGGEPDTLRADS